MEQWPPFSIMKIETMDGELKSKVPRQAKRPE
jgi:hypothetical protein